MNKIEISTKVLAPIKRCFQLSTSIDLHKISANQTNEQAIGGRKKGLIKLGETVTWKAKHFGFYHKLKVKITEYDEPNYFVDEMVKGSFKFMKHKHEFKQIGKETIIKDTFEFSSPFGILGKVVDKLVLKKYLTKFLNKRNSVVKEFAETEKWREVLENQER